MLGDDRVEFESGYGILRNGIIGEPVNMALPEQVKHLQLLRFASGFEGCTENGASETIADA
jgi:hypothetical protein